MFQFSEEDFVRQRLPESQNSEQSPRFRDDICVKVVGLPDEYDAFIARRIVEVAREVHAPVAKAADCRVNVNVIFTTEPQALVDLDQAIRLEKPDNPVLAQDHTNRGRLLALDHRDSDALAAWDAAIKLVRDYDDAHVLRIELLLRLKRYEEAIAPLQAAVRLQEGNPSAHYNLAVALSRTGHKEEADKEFAIHRQLAQKPAPTGPTLTPQNSNTTALLIAVSPVDENTVWAVGTGSTDVVTTDGGNTWRSGVVPTSNAGDIQLRDVQGVSAQVAYVLSIGNLPTDFGFPIDVHAHEPETIYVVPIKSDSEHFPLDGRLRVYRSRTGGNEWEALTNGLPQEHCYVNVLRDAMAVDRLDSCGVYFGTTGGQVYVSADSGDSWAPIVRDLPAVLSVEVQTLP